VHALAIAALLAATAVTPPVDPAPRAHAACQTVVLGFDSDHRLRRDTLVADRVVRTTRSSKGLKAEVTAGGFYDRSHLDLVSRDGVPRSVTFRSNRKKLRATQVDKFDQDGFAPRLFAENYTFYAYSITRGTMRRWGVIRSRNGHLRFVPSGVVGNGFRDVTSLQASVFAKVHGVPSELLYATTRSGALWQIVVPLNGPRRARVVTLATAGYEGTTELAWSACSPRGKDGLHSLVAIDPAADRATWTTVTFPLTRPKAVLRGAVTGETDWRLRAVL
jgi:hypothetical protein